MIRINFKSNLNKFSENRRKNKINQLKNICPHIKLFYEGRNYIGYEPYFLSPSGTRNHICSRCDLERPKEIVCKIINDNIFHYINKP